MSSRGRWSTSACTPLASASSPSTRPVTWSPSTHCTCGSATTAGSCRSATVSPEEIFVEYAYYSSFSDAWLAHTKKYADDMTERFGLGADSLVVEVASNDGYMLQWFVEKQIPSLGIEPAKNTAEIAEKKGVRTITEFLAGPRAAARDEGVRANLLAGKNVMAQIPNLNSFVGGLKVLLADDGVITIEFPHLQRLIEGNQFDTIYREHYSYFSLYSTERLFADHGLVIFDVDELWTHGGSLRIYAGHVEDTRRSRVEPRGAQSSTLARSHSGTRIRRHTSGSTNRSRPPSARCSSS